MKKIHKLLPPLPSPSKVFPPDPRDVAPCRSDGAQLRSHQGRLLLQRRGGARGSFGRNQNLVPFLCRSAGRTRCIDGLCVFSITQIKNCAQKRETKFQGRPGFIIVRTTKCTKSVSKGGKQDAHFNHPRRKNRHGSLFNFSISVIVALPYRQYLSAQLGKHE